MSHDEFAVIKLMRERGYRVTQQRLMVLDAVCDSGEHSTLSEITRHVKELDPSIDQSTVYRTLNLLVEIGVVVSADIGGDGKVYEIAGSIPHHHLVCQVCGIEQAISHSTLSSLSNDLYQKYGFKLDVDHLVLTGICAKCIQITP